MADPIIGAILRGVVIDEQIQYQNFIYAKHSTRGITCIFVCVNQIFAV